MRVGIVALVALVALGVLAIAFATADARPGGGHTSSGGGHTSSSSHSSSSGGGHSSWSSSGGSLDGGVMILLLVIVVVVIAVGAVVSANQRARDSWASTSFVNYDSAPAPPPPTRADLAPLIARDPEFSRSTFEDFVFELYAAAQRGRNDPARLGALSAYLSPKATDQLASRGAAPTQIVIGSLTVARLSTFNEPEAREAVRPSERERLYNDDGPMDLVDVRIESTLHTDSPKYVVETWTFMRKQGVLSKPPTHNRTWPCPNCGAPWSVNATRTCSYCNEPMGSGRFDWSLSWIQIVSTTPVMASLTGTIEEYGNDLPTVVASDASATMASLTADDPQVAFGAITARTGLIYRRLNEAWNANDLKKVRGLVTQSLRDYLAYWLDEYKRQGLSNQLADAAIENVELSKVIRDRHYDAVTLRVFAGGNDFTLDGAGKLVGGSPHKARRYTEYWTLIRSSARRGPVASEPKCANCGAPLEDVSDQGDCSTCHATIELGSFDWILSKIEQDDNYTG